MKLCRNRKRHQKSKEQLYLKQSNIVYLPKTKNAAEEITDAEHQELLVYIDRVEQQDVERAEALIKLAQLRQVDLKILIQEFLPTHSNVT
jgi:hypothetical protein